MMSLTSEGIIAETRNSPGPGNIVLIEIESEDVTEVFSSFGRLGVASEKVAEEAVREAREYLVSRAVAAEHFGNIVIQTPVS